MATPAPQSPYCDICRNFNTDGIRRGHPLKVVRYSEVETKGQLEECLLCTLLYRVLTQWNVASPVGDSVSIQANFGGPFFASWLEESGRQPHLEIYQQRGMYSLGVKGETLVQPSHHNREWKCDERNRLGRRHCSRSKPCRHSDKGLAMDPHV
jgi:hypothetical protein